MEDAFIISRQTQVDLLKRCREDPAQTDTLLTPYPKLLNGIKNGRILLDTLIIYLEESIETYRNAAGDHESKKFESDVSFSQTVAKDTRFYERKGLTPPTSMNIEEAKRVTKRKMTEQGNPRNVKRMKLGD